MILGERRYAMRIWLDRARLAAYRLTPQDVESALRQQNVEIPSGRVESDEREFTVLSETDLREPEQFEEMILQRRRRVPGRSRTSAGPSWGPNERRSSASKAPRR
jgi:multidrug efflux pump